MVKPPIVTLIENLVNSKMVIFITPSWKIGSVIIHNNFHILHWQISEISFLDMKVPVGAIVKFFLFLSPEKPGEDT